MTSWCWFDHAEFGDDDGDGDGDDDDDDDDDDDEDDDEYDDDDDDDDGDDDDDDDDEDDDEYEDEDDDDDDDDDDEYDDDDDDDDDDSNPADNHHGLAAAVGFIVHTHTQTVCSDLSSCPTRDFNHQPNSPTNPNIKRPKELTPQSISVSSHLFMVLNGTSTNITLLFLWGICWSFAKATREHGHPPNEENEKKTGWVGLYRRLYYPMILGIKIKHYNIRIPIQQPV